MSTDAELRDAAWAELAQTTLGWTKVSGYDPARLALTHWGRGKALLDKIGSPPPPTGLLRDRPPGLLPGTDPTNPANYPGFLVVDLPPLGTILDCAGRSVFVRPGLIHWTVTGVLANRTNWGFRNYDRLVSIGTTLNVKNTASHDDFAIQLAGGSPSAVAYFEGWDVVGVNGWTARNAGTLVVQQSRCLVEDYQHLHGNPGVHPDLIQIWLDQSGANSGPKIRMHRFTGFSDMTFFSNLENDPLTWDMLDVNVEGQPKTSATGTLGGDFHYPGSRTGCQYTYRNVYFNPTGSGTLNLDQHVGYLDGLNYYTIHDMSGGHPDYLGTPAAHQCPWQAEQGDTWTCTEAGTGLTGQTVTWGPPPTGDFVPAGSVGVGYVPIGYA